jgi:hypothetical protein
MGVVAIVVGVILFSMSSAPTRKTVELERIKVADVATSRARIDERLGAYRKAGEPILVADFTVKPIPPEQNAADALMAAMKWLDTKEYNDDPYWNINLAPKYTPAQQKIIDDAMTKFAPALALIDQADGRTGVDWKIKWETPKLKTLLPSLNGARQLANLLAGAADSAHRAGRDDEALHRLTQLVMLVRHTDRHPAIVGHLVAAGISRLTSTSMSHLLPTLKIGTNPGDAPPEKVSALIATMLDPSTLQAGFIYSGMTERMSVYDTFQCLIDGKLTAAQLATYTGSSKAGQPAIGGATQAELLTELPVLLDRASAFVAACKTDRLPEFQRLSPPPADTKLAESQALTPTYDRFGETHFLALTYFRLSAVALAVRWWSAEHDGAMPASLEELVPKYLAAIPGDPLMPAPAVLQFRAGSDPAVFSAGAAPKLRRTPSSKPSRSDEVAIRLTDRPR